MTAASLAQLLRQTLPFSAGLSTATAGLHVEIIEGNTRIVASNGAQIAWAQAPGAPIRMPPRTLLQPEDAWWAAGQLLHDPGPITATVEHVKRPPRLGDIPVLRVSSAQQVVEIEILDGEFPDYQQAGLNPQASSLIVFRLRMKEALQVVLGACRYRREIACGLVVRGGVVALEVRHPERAPLVLPFAEDPSRLDLVVGLEARRLAVLIERAPEFFHLRLGPTSVDPVWLQEPTGLLAQASMLLHKIPEWS